MNISQTPEFKKILREVYDSGQAKTSEQAISMARAEYRKKYHGPVTVQQRRYAQRKSFENPKNDFHIVFETETGKPIKSFQRLPNAKKFAARMMAKDGVGSYYIQRYSEWKKNPRKKKVKGTCKNCGGVMSGPVCLNCLKSNPIAIYNPAQPYTHFKRGDIVKVGKWGLGKIVDSDQLQNNFEVELAIGGRHWFRSDRLKPVKKSDTEKPYFGNPAKAEPLPMAVIEIRYKRTGGEHAGQLFKHNFKVRPKVFGLPDGSILIKGSKALWGTV
mgnify:CR=1 FL=1